MWRQTASYVDRILKGAKIADAAAFLVRVNDNFHAGVTNRFYERAYLYYEGLPWRGELWLGDDLRLGPPSRHADALFAPQIIVIDAVLYAPSWRGARAPQIPEKADPIYPPRRLRLDGERRDDDAASEHRHEGAPLHCVIPHQLNHPARRMRRCSASSQGICCRTSAHALASHG